MALLPYAASDDRGRAGSREGGRAGARAERRTARPACGALPVHTIGSRDGWHMLARAAALRLDPVLASLDEIPSREVLKAKRRQGAPRRRALSNGPLRSRDQSPSGTPCDPASGQPAHSGATPSDTLPEESEHLPSQPCDDQHPAPPLHSLRPTSTTSRSNAYKSSVIQQRSSLMHSRSDQRYLSSKYADSPLGQPLSTIASVLWTSG